MHRNNKTPAEPQQKQSSWKTALQSRAMKNGAYASALSALMLALVVAVNLIVSALPTQYTSIDLTDQKLFSLSDESKQLADTLATTVNVYYLARNGQEDVAVQSLLKRYESLSKHIKVEQKDPVVYPTFAAKYDAQSAAAGSIIVDGNNGRTRVIDASELYAQAVDYQTYETSKSFAGESKITSALSFVTREDLPTVYWMVGHGERVPSESFARALADANLQTQELNLLAQEAVPADAGTVLIHAPEKDLSDAEAQKLSAYLATGGSLTLVTNYGQYTAESHPNLAEILAQYGLAAQNGLVLETDENYFLSGYPYYLLPNLEEHAILEPIAKSFVIAPMAHGLTVNQELSEDILSGALLTSSSNAYLKENVIEEQPTDVAEGDLQGTFAMATVAENMADQSKVVWMSTSGFFDDGMNQLVSGANSDFVLNVLNWGVGNTAGITLHAKSLVSVQLLVPQAAGSFWSTLFSIVLPVSMLAIGLFIWARRRAR